LECQILSVPDTYLEPALFAVFLQACMAMYHYVSNNFHDWSRQSVVYSSTGSHRGLLVFPSVGYVNGGDSVVVKILGSGFEFWESLNDLSCTFGESTSLGLALNRDEVLCSTPRFNEVGLVDVSLVNSSTKHAFGGRAFLFVIRVKRLLFNQLYFLQAV